MNVRERFLTGLTADDRALLERVPLLNGLDAAARADLLQDAMLKSYPRGASLFLQGDPARAIFIILDGWIKLYRATEDGAESVIAVFGRGESFAEAAIFDLGVYPVNALAIEAVRLLALPASSFVAKIERNSAYALAMMASMSSRLRRLVQQVEQLTVRSSAERLASFLLTLSGADDGPVRIVLPMEKALIAGRLGMQPETFSRALSKLRQHGVSCRGNEVNVVDLAALRRFSRRT
jgi:CRP-like cAMP-binding protein